MSVTKCPDCDKIISIQFPFHDCKYGDGPEVQGFKIVQMTKHEAATELCRLRDRLTPMLQATYEGSNEVAISIPGSSSKSSTKQRKTTLKEARLRIAYILPRLNAIINFLVD